LRPVRALLCRSDGFADPRFAPFNVAGLLLTLDYRHPLSHTTAPMFELGYAPAPI
jgi:hypothetical protein